MSTFFSNLPNIFVADPSTDIVPENYVITKNIFRRAKVVPAALANATYFEKYTIPMNKKPYHVAHDIYGDVDVEWIILLINDITNIYTQWPLTNAELENKVREEYGLSANSVRYWRTREFKNDKGEVLVEGGLVVQSTYVPRFPPGSPVPPANEYKEPVTNYLYELEANEAKREIYLIYPSLITRFVNEYKRIMQYSTSEDLMVINEVGYRTDEPAQLKRAGSESTSINVNFNS